MCPDFRLLSRPARLIVQPGSLTCSAIIGKCIRTTYDLAVVRYLQQGVMGAYWSSYAGSTDIAGLAASKQDEAKEYDYIVCGGESA